MGNVLCNCETTFGVSNGTLRVGRIDYWRKHRFFQLLYVSSTVARGSNPGRVCWSMEFFMVAQYICLGIPLIKSKIAKFTDEARMALKGN